MSAVKRLSAKTVLAVALIGFGQFLSSSQAHAGSCSAAQNGCVDVLVTELYVHSNGFTYIQTDGDETALSGNCTAHANQYLVVARDTTGYNDKLEASILTNFVQGRRATLIRTISNADPLIGCQIAYVRFD